MAYAFVGSSLAVVSFVVAAMLWAVVDTLVPVGLPFDGYRLWLMCVGGGAVSFAIHWAMGAKGGMAQVLTRLKGSSG